MESVHLTRRNQVPPASIAPLGNGANEFHHDQETQHQQADEVVQEQASQYQGTLQDNVDPNTAVPARESALASITDLHNVNFIPRAHLQQPDHPNHAPNHRSRRCFDWRMTEGDVDFCKNRVWFKTYRKLPPIMIGDADTGMHAVRGIGRVDVRVLCGPYARGTTTVRLTNVLHIPTMPCNGFHLDRIIAMTGAQRAEFTPPKIQVYGKHGGQLIWMKMDSVMIYQLMLPCMYPWSEFEAMAVPGSSQSLAFTLNEAQRAWFEALKL